MVSFHGAVSRIVNYVDAWAWKIRIETGCKFWGKVYFHKCPGSSIFIANNCSFRSAATSNLMGLHCPCMISTLSKNARIVIGHGCGFSGTVIASAKSITLGNGVRCGANTLITDTDWHTDDYRAGADAPVVIKDNVWLGYGVKVFKGVRIGENSLIGACSVVTKDIPPNVVAAGNPCRVIRRVDNNI